jgi:hypothetical protein
MGNWSPARGQGQGIRFLRAHVGHTGNNCLIWPLSGDRDGYGIFGFEGKNYKAHRWMCEATHGPAPTPEHHAAHECGNGHRGCVNPQHLVWKTPTANARDRLRHGTVNPPGRPRRKLTVEQVREIIAMKGKKPHLEVAAIYNISDSQVRKIQQGITWRGGQLNKGGFKPGDPRNPLRSNPRNGSLVLKRDAR